MAALCILENLLTFQSGGKILTYRIGLTEPPFPVMIERPEKKDSESKDKQTGTEEGNDQLLTYGVSPGGRFLVACDDYKQLWVWAKQEGQNEGKWTLSSKRVLPRRSSSLTFASDERTVVIADKSGDAYSYDLCESEGDGILLAGHISMLLDVLLCGKDDNFLVTCDRDEKIRVSRFPNAYNIQSYCLGHTEFVSKLGYFKEEDLLVSGGGDGTLRIWNYLSGTELYQLDLKEEFISSDQSPTADPVAESDEVIDTSADQSLPANENAEGCKVKAKALARTESVADVKCLACCQKNKCLAIACDRKNVILLYKLCIEDGKPGLSKKQKLLLTGSDVWALTFDGQNNLWYLQSDNQQTSGVFAFNQDKDEYEPLDSCNGDEMENIRYIVSDLNTNQQDFFKAAFVQPSISTPLHKVKIDNMTEYQERKQQKISEKLNKRKGTQGVHHDCAEQLKKQKP